MKRASLLRRIASSLISHAAAVLPPSRAAWGEAMKNELDYVGGDFKAVMWASGCLIASYFQKSRDASRPFRMIAKKPSAFLPIAMSLMALTVVIVDLAIFGIPHPGTDEGTAAHLWQLLMAGQMPVLLFFAVKWLPSAPRQALLVLALQAGAVLAAMAPVYLLHL
jgi:hypothetical protein